MEIQIDNKGPIAKISVKKKLDFHSLFEAFTYFLIHI